MIQPNTISGSVQAGARPRRQRRASRAAPSAASSTAGTPMYQNTQCRLSCVVVMPGGLRCGRSARLDAGSGSERLSTGGRRSRITDRDGQHGGGVAAATSPRTVGRPRSHSGHHRHRGQRSPPPRPPPPAGSATLLMWPGTAGTAPARPRRRRARRPAGRRAAGPPAAAGDSSRIPQYGITGRMSLAPSMRTSRVRPSARPPSAARTRAALPSAASESMTRHSPPRNRICASGSL